MNKLFIFFICLFGFSATYCQTLTNGEYFIQVNATQKYLAIEGISQDNSAKLVQWDFANQQNHKFIIKNLGNNMYTLKAVHSGKYLSTEGDAIRGAKIIQYDWVNQDNQKWIITKSALGYQIACLQNQQRIYLSGFNAATSTTGNGSYFIINNDDLPMNFTFKKNEVEQPEKVGTKRKNF